MAIVIMFWAAFAPGIMFVGVPIALIISVKNLLCAGPFVPLREKFTPIFKILLYPSACVSGYEYKSDRKYLCGVAAIFAFFHLLCALHCFKIIYVSFIPTYLANFTYPLLGIFCLFGSISLLPVAFQYDFGSQKFFFVHQTVREYRDSLNHYASDVKGFSLDWQTPTFENNVVYLNTKKNYYRINIESEYKDDSVVCVAIEISREASAGEIYTLTQILIQTFDNTATDQKISKIAGRLAGCVSTDCRINLIGYSIGYANADGDFALCVGLND